MSNAPPEMEKNAVHFMRPRKLIRSHNFQGRPNISMRSSFQFRD